MVNRLAQHDHEGAYDTSSHSEQSNTCEWGKCHVERRGPLGPVGLQLTRLCAEENAPWSLPIGHNASIRLDLAHAYAGARRQLVSFDFNLHMHNATVTRSRDGISTRRAGRRGDGFTI